MPRRVEIPRAGEDTSGDITPPKVAELENIFVGSAIRNFPKAKYGLPPALQNAQARESNDE